MGDTWKKLVVSGQLAMLMAAPSGCLSRAVVQNAGSRPETLALLALTLPLDAIGAAIASAGGGRSSSSTVTPAPLPQAVLGPDPNDWVGKCEGPLVCQAHQHFVCEGQPGDCACRCVITPAPACVPATPYEPSVVARCAPKPKKDAKAGPVALR
jgi:hypothetical protein